MLSLYWHVTRSAAKRVLSSWPVALAPVVYGLLLTPVSVIARGLGSLIGGLVMYLAVALCLSSYLELISQSVSGSRFRVSWDELKRTFLVRFGDVINVLFTFWVIGLLTSPMTAGEHGKAIAAMIGFAMAFFFNVLPEVLYQGSSRSFMVLVDSGRFVTQHPVAWFLPNLMFGAAALGATGGLYVKHPAELLLAFSALFSPREITLIIAQLPWWLMAVGLLALHFVMLFRGLLFRELESGSSNARMRAFRAKMK